MDSRQQKLFKIIVSEYAKTAIPVGSKLLAEKYDLDVSSATIRNEMAILEQAGYIYQPHTSAGRVPTENGYQYYVDNFLQAKEPNLTVQKKLLANSDDIKQLAKSLAEISNSSVFISFAPYDSYYTGLSNLFSQPEFNDPALVYDVSRIVDHLDEVTAKIFNQIDEVKILLGKKNPFGQACATIIAPYQIQDSRGIFGLLGPLRLDYEGTLGLVNHVQKLISKK